MALINLGTHDIEPIYQFVDTSRARLRARLTYTFRVTIRVLGEAEYLSEIEFGFVSAVYGVGIRRFPKEGTLPEQTYLWALPYRNDSAIDRWVNTGLWFRRVPTLQFPSRLPKITASVLVDPDIYQ